MVVSLEHTQFPPIILMGVSGSGKTTMGVALSDVTGIPFIDGDDLHPDENKEKMRAGHPLGDADRIPWLHRIGELIDAGIVEGHSTIVACSALKRSYRDLLRRHAGSLYFVHLDLPRAALEERTQQRSHEYMPSSLLDSQLATLEPLQPDEAGIVVDATLAPDKLARVILNVLPTLNLSSH